MEESKPICKMPTLESIEAWTPPKWALMERKLIDLLNEAVEPFIDRYTRPDGTLIWRDEWPGMDGSDDPYEAFMNLALLYALGGHEKLRDLSIKMWEAITWQWTQYGQIHNEFDGYYDWMHHGEGYLFLYFFGISDPRLLTMKQRSLRFADYYTGDDPEVNNYDKTLKLIRSPITGSKGPRFEMTWEDWITHRGVLDDYPAPFEDIPGVDYASGTCKWSDDKIYAEILKRINARMAKGDVPLNLNATSLMTHAFMYSSDTKFKEWVLGYLDAWKERTARNGGITPDNVGLSGVIGEYNDGKWWGGYYGWRWSHGFASIMEPILNASMNAVLLTGDMDQLVLARNQLDQNWSLGIEKGGKRLLPRKHIDKGWTDYQLPNPNYPIYLWTVSMAQEDVERFERYSPDDRYDHIDIPSISGRNPVSKKETKHYIANTVPWFQYMQGKFPDYPEQALDANYRLINRQLEKLKSESGDPRSWDWDQVDCIHKWQEMNPIYFEALAQLTLGAPMHVSHGGLQHARVRYYDAKHERPGLPDDVAALVEQISADSVTVTLINLNMFENRETIIQAGSFGEHQFVEAVSIGQDGQKQDAIAVHSKWLLVRLGPGAGSKLCIQMKRYANTPSYNTPWFHVQDVATIQGRQLSKEADVHEARTFK